MSDDTLATLTSVGRLGVSLFFTLIALRMIWVYRFGQFHRRRRSLDLGLIWSMVSLAIVTGRLGLSHFWDAAVIQSPWVPLVMTFNALLAGIVTLILLGFEAHCNKGGD